MTILIAAILASGAAFFAVSSITAKQQLKTMTYIETANAEIAAAKRRKNRATIKQRIAGYAARQGWAGNLTPVVVAGCAAYLLAATVLKIVGIGGIVGAVLAVPVAAGLVMIGSNHIAKKRQTLFRRQLMTALTLAAAQIEAGSGPHRALEQITPNLPNPLGAEFNRVLNASVASKDLIGEFGKLRQTYPSKAIDMFVLALEISSVQGGALAPALRQAASGLQQEFELVEEANAELAQTKSEFYAIAVLIALIGAATVLGGDESTRAAYLTPIGMGGAVLAVLNYSFGCWRALRIIGKPKRIRP